MRKFAIIGLGRFGMTLTLELVAKGHEVIAIDINPAHIEAVADRVAHAVILDATDEKALASQGVSAVDCAVVAIGENFEANVLTTINCKNLGIATVVTRGASRNECKILERIGADLVIQPEELSARQLSHQLAIPTIRGYMELFAGVAVCQIIAPAVFHDRTLAEIHLRRNYEVNLVAIRRPDKKAKDTGEVVYPGAETKILPGDTLVIVGSEERVCALAEGTA